MSTYGRTASHRWLSVMTVAACLVLLWESFRKLIASGEDPEVAEGSSFGDLDYANSLRRPVVASPTASQLNLAASTRPHDPDEGDPVPRDRGRFEWWYRLQLWWRMRREPPEDYQTPSASDPDFCTTVVRRAAHG